MTEPIQFERGWKEIFEKAIEEKYCLKLKLSQVNTELINEIAKNKQLKTYLDEILSHNYHLKANKLYTLKKWHAETLHELKMSHQELKISMKDFTILNQELKIFKQQLKISNQELKISNQKMKKIENR